MQTEQIIGGRIYRRSQDGAFKGFAIERPARSIGLIGIASRDESERLDARLPLTDASTTSPIQLKLGVRVDPLIPIDAARVLGTFPAIERDPHTGALEPRRTVHLAHVLPHPNWSLYDQLSHVRELVEHGLDGVQIDGDLPEIEDLKAALMNRCKRIGFHLREPMLLEYRFDGERIANALEDYLWRDLCTDVVIDLGSGALLTRILAVIDRLAKRFPGLGISLACSWPPEVVLNRFPSILRLFPFLSIEQDLEEKSTRAHDFLVAAHLAMSQ